MRCATISLLTLMAFASTVSAQEPADSGDLAKQLANPIASLISVPLKIDWDTSIGPADADRTLTIFQPVVPFSINDDWNLVVRTIVPYVSAQSPLIGGASQSGLGDTTQSFFFSPQAATASGWVWAVGPVAVYPTATEDALGGGKWGVGPTFVALRQNGPWTVGVLANQIWSVAGSEEREDSSVAFVQPFASYTTRGFTTFGLNIEATYDWRASEWTVPINFTVGQLVRFGSQPVSFTLGARIYADTPAGGPDWGLRFTTTLLFPRD